MTSAANTPGGESASPFKLSRNTLNDFSTFSNPTSPVSVLGPQPPPLQAEGNHGVEVVKAVLSRAQYIRASLKATMEASRRKKYPRDPDNIKTFGELAHLVDEEEAGLEDVSRAFDLLEKQLSVLVSLKVKHQIEQDDVMAKLEEAREGLLQSLNLYRGTDWPVLQEAFTFVIDGARPPLLNSSTAAHGRKTDLQIPANSPNKIDLVFDRGEESNDEISPSDSVLVAKEEQRQEGAIDAPGALHHVFRVVGNALRGFMSNSAKIGLKTIKLSGRAGRSAAKGSTKAGRVGVRAAKAFIRGAYSSTKPLTAAFVAETPFKHELLFGVLVVWAARNKINSSSQIRMSNTLFSKQQPRAQANTFSLPRVTVKGGATKNVNIGSLLPPQDDSRAPYVATKAAAMNKYAEKGHGTKVQKRSGSMTVLDGRG